MKRVLAQVRKELTQLSRDKLTLALALALPILLLLLLSNATSLTVEHIPVAVQDLDKTPLSRNYVEAVGASLSFDVSAVPPDVSPERTLEQNLVRAARIFSLAPLRWQFSRKFVTGSTRVVKTSNISRPACWLSVWRCFRPYWRHL